MQAALRALFSEQEELGEHAGPRLKGTPIPAFLVMSNRILVGP